MRIRVDKIPSTGSKRAFGLTDDWAAAAATVALEASPTALSGSISVSPPVQHRSVDVQVAADAAARRTCDRCGEPVDVTVGVQSTLRYLPANSDGGVRTEDEEIELAEDDLDLGWYEDGSLVLADVLTEALALATPSRILCEDTSGCDARTTALLEAAKPDLIGHPAFAALKNLKN